MFTKKHISYNIIAQQIVDDRIITIFNDDLSSDLYGISILNKKYQNRLKYITWDCILLRKGSLLNICNGLLNPPAEENSIFEKCSCFSEMLELSVLDDTIYLNIWDNYFSKYNKKIFKSEIWFDFETAKTFANSIIDKLSENEKEKR
jgi:hypothetical protein